MILVEILSIAMPFFLQTPPTMSNVIYTRSSSSYKSILDFSINNLRFAKPWTSKPSIFVTPIDESQVQTVIFSSREYGGVWSTVGVSGLTGGGCYGLLRQKYGLAADNVIDARIVNADGRIL
ncbi:hypothetical protein AgCh_035635 [Apium graveolens]